MGSTKKTKTTVLTVVLAMVGIVCATAATPAGAQETSPCAGRDGGIDFNVIQSDAAVIRGTDARDLICAGPSGNTIFGLAGNDVIYGGGGADVIWGGAGFDLLIGGGGPDVLRGGYGRDSLVGDGGNDQLFGGPGSDLLRGGAHQDLLSGGNGNDRLEGGPGFDQVLGGDGADELLGGLGDDYLAGGKGLDELFGDEGDDTMFGGTSHDLLAGGDGDDQLTGGDGFDTLSGGDGNDQIRGGNGDDVIRGGNGDDRINGGAHNDQVLGGAGADRCLSAEQVRDCANVPDNWPETLTDFGVTDDTIFVGITADLSGPFSGLSSAIVSAQKAYFDRVNERGGIDGREVRLATLDNAYDVPTQLDNYAQLSRENGGVVMISHSTGSPHTAAISGDLVDDNLIAVPLAWYSGWAFEEQDDGQFGANVFELQTNYCFEAMNGVEFLVDQSGLDNPKLAIVSRPGNYGQDGAAGAKIAAAELGLEVVDLEASIAGDDFTPIVSTLVQEQPDIVWITANPGEMAQIFGGAAAGGLTALWSGNSPSYNVALLDSAVGPALDAFYFHSTYTALWGANESAGMVDMMAAIEERIPGANYAQADTYATGWTEAMFTEAVLTLASENGDLTRAGIVAAANEVTVDFQGLAPNQTWSGTPNDTVVRGSYIYDVVLADATVTESITSPGSSGLALVAENFVSNTAANHNFTEPCFVSPG